jgi:hypothetical protein
MVKKSVYLMQHGPLPFLSGIITGLFILIKQFHPVVALGIETVQFLAPALQLLLKKDAAALGAFMPGWQFPGEKLAVWRVGS